VDRFFQSARAARIHTQQRASWGAVCARVIAAHRTTEFFFFSCGVVWAGWKPASVLESRVERASGAARGRESLPCAAAFFEGERVSSAAHKPSLQRPAWLIREPVIHADELLPALQLVYCTVSGHCAVSAFGEFCDVSRGGYR
jgi:hypothetical protein